MFDILIIGAGAVGCAIARELSRYKLSVCVLEKECDVAFGTSGRNSAVVHAGFNSMPGSLMAKLCVEGNEGFESLCMDLDVPYKKTGKYIIAFDQDDIETLNWLLYNGQKNHCKGLSIIAKEELYYKVPGIGGAIAALESPNTAIFDPFIYTIALAENAKANGVEFHFNSEVKSIKSDVNGYFTVSTNNCVFNSSYIINCAGLFSDKVSELAGINKYKIYPCRGEYLILDRIADKMLSVPIYPAPKKNIGGLGIHLTPTIHGNIIIGPSADYIDDNDNYSCERVTMDRLLEEAKKLYPAINSKQVIGSYSGIRSKQVSEKEGGFRDFVIKEEEDCKGLINLIGIESPGITASVPIAKMVTHIIGKNIPLEEKESFLSKRKGPFCFRDLPDSVKADLIRKDPEYGEVICRCNTVTKKEIRQAIENSLGAISIASIKYRAWATTGRCQGGYCLSKISEILEKEYGIKAENISLRGPGSELYSGVVK